jgi:hypothetical protein
MSVPEINPLQDHPKLIDSDLLRRLFALRPREAVTLESLLPLSEAKYYVKKSGKSASAKREIGLSQHNHFT